MNKIDNELFSNWLFRPEVIAERGNLIACLNDMSFPVALNEMTRGQLIEIIRSLLLRIEDTSISRRDREKYESVIYDEDGHFAKMIIESIRGDYVDTQDYIRKNE